MEAFAMVSEEFCLTVFHFHTNRRIFLLTDDSAKNPDNCPFAEQLQSKNICWSLHIAGDSACNGTAINKTMRTCPAKIKKERKNSPVRRVFYYIIIFMQYYSVMSPVFTQPSFLHAILMSGQRTAGSMNEIRIRPSQSMPVMAVFRPAAMSAVQPEYTPI